MRILKTTFYFYFALFLNISFAQEGKNKLQEKIIDEYLTNCAEKYNYNTRMQDWQDCLDQGLKKDNTIAYLWQQKAMPYFLALK